MKNIIKVAASAMVLGGMFLTTACSEDFIKEVRRDAAASSYLDEPEGLVSMSNSLYNTLTYFFSNESSYAYTNYGTDEFMVAGDNSNGMYNDYDVRLGSVVTPAVNSNTQAITTFWDHLYSWIARCNTVLDKADKVLANDSRYNEVVGTASFIRGYSYLFLVMQFGDIPLIVDAVKEPQREFTRTPRSEVYAQVIKDLEKAHETLTADATRATKNYITKYAAAHYLAKAHLWRASEINDDWNSSTKASDLTAVIKYADEVIAAHPLVNEYNDLFNNFTNYDTSITETNTEIVLSTGNTDSDVTNRKSHWGLALFTAWYQGFPFMKRDVACAREYQRMKTTPSYAYFLYDLENDSRFWKSFKTTYAVNNTAGKKITVEGVEMPAEEYFDSQLSEYLSTMYVINRMDYKQKYYNDEVNVDKTVTKNSLTRTDYSTGKLIPAINALYIYDRESPETVVGTSMTPDYNTLLAPLCKYLDGAVNANNRGDGFRDGLLARSAEDYFFKAEALIRQNKLNEGIAVLKPLRDRAQFKADEARDAYVDGGAAFNTSKYRSQISGFQVNSGFYPRNSYYYSLGGWEATEEGAAYREATNAKASVLQVVTSDNYPAEDMYVIEKLGYTTPYDKAMCYLLNEKSREMYGEYLRWMDLARTKTLEKRLVFNDQAYAKDLVDITGHNANIKGDKFAVSANGGSFNPAKHYVRPIPQTFLDNITKDGKPLTNEEKSAMQNPGY